MKLILALYIFISLQAKEVEIYNEQTNEYKYIDVSQERSYDNRIEIDTYDYETNEYNTYSISKEPAEEETPTQEE